MFRAIPHQLCGFKVQQKMMAAACVSNRGAPTSARHRKASCRALEFTLWARKNRARTGLGLLQAGASCLKPPGTRASDMRLAAKTKAARDPGLLYH